MESRHNQNSKITIVQKGPPYYDAKNALDRARYYIGQAKEQGSDLVVFGEGWFSGYPVWLDHYANVARWDEPSTKQVYRLMYDNAVTVPGAISKALATLAKELEIVIVMGCNEAAGDTLYNSILIFTADGMLANHHRKLMPTFTEKMVHGLGDAAGLKSVETTFGRLTASICWEHWMPLTRQTLHEAGEDIHIALWPKVHEMHQVASRHYAFEGRCWVVAVGQMVHRDHMPEILGDQAKPDVDWLLNGGSCVIDPRGHFYLEPQFDQDDIIHVTINDVFRRREELMTLDVSGHYHRPDVFDLNVDRTRHF